MSDQLNYKQKCDSILLSRGKSEHDIQIPAGLSMEEIIRMIESGKDEKKEEVQVLR